MYFVQNWRIRILFFFIINRYYSKSPSSTIDHGAQHYTAQSNVDIQSGNVLRGTATNGRRRRQRMRFDVIQIVAADQEDVREKHIARRKNITQVSKT